jgi:hypothetical protein
MAIHSATGVDQVGQILREFFASLPVQERSLLRPNLMEADTYSDSVVGQKALQLARAELFAAPADPALPLITEVGAVMAAASWKIAVIEMDARKTEGRALLTPS